MLSFRNATGEGGEAEVGGNVAGADVRTVPARSHRRRRLDHRSLRTGDYLADPIQFGTHPDPAWVPPSGEDAVSQQVARVPHRLAVATQAKQARAAARIVTTRFGFSKSFWHLCLPGHAWMGETVLAAAVFLARAEPGAGRADREPRPTP